MRRSWVLFLLYDVLLLLSTAASGQGLQDHSLCQSQFRFRCSEITVQLYCPKMCSPCPPACTWGVWSKWDACTKACGGGTQARSRSCPVKGSCIGSATETRTCNDQECVGARRLLVSGPPLWLLWSHWGNCSQACGGGTQNRTRGCTVKGQCVGEALESRTCNTMECPPPRDILFLFDESGNVGTSNLTLYAQFMEAIINSFCGYIDIGEQKTRVGLVSYADEQFLHMVLNERDTKKGVLDNIKEFRKKIYGGGNTCLLDSLEYVRGSLLSTAFGARKNADKVVILLSTGCDNCREQSMITNLLKDIGKKYSDDGVCILIYFVGLVDSKCPKQFQALADSMQCYQAFYMSNWDDVTSSVNNLITGDCQTTWPPLPNVTQ